MMRSLFAGVSGLKNHQTRMDVIGNNIANVNTVGFKKSRVTFQDMLSQTLRGASTPQGNRAGTNPMQVGLGMSLASIDVIHTPGSPQSTGKNTDLSIEGEGFFMLSDGQNIYYTRAGNFDFDYNKTFYNTANGMIVQGIMADANGVIDPKGAITDINLAAMVSTLPKATTSIDYNKNLDSRALSLTTTVNTAGPNYPIPSADMPVTKIEIVDSTSTTLTEGIHYTVDYDNGTINITGGTGPYDITYYKPNFSSAITAYDSKGDTHQVTVFYTKIADNTWEVRTKIDNNFLTTSGTGTITYNTDGTFDSSTVTDATTTIAGADNLTIALDFTKTTQFAGDFTALAFSQNGYGPGDLQGISVDITGTITGTYSNGQSRKLAQVALATFTNPSGLIKAGNNLFQVSNNSGEPDKGIPGISGRGIIKPETLEMSNVDLSQEFVDMIITQRGFQANSRVITTSDQILEELVNLRR